MSTNAEPQVEALDYDLEPSVRADTPQRMKALADPLRSLLLDLVLERAMTVSELAERVRRPRGSVAHHVDVLVDAGLMKVVRTRQVRALTERFYGRAARTIELVHHDGDDLPFFADARREADLDAMKCEESSSGFTMRHARIPRERAAEFFDRVLALAVEFSALRREGDREYAFIAGIFPTKRTVSAT